MNVQSGQTNTMTGLIVKLKPNNERKYILYSKKRKPLLNVQKNRSDHYRQSIDRRRCKMHVDQVKNNHANKKINAKHTLKNQSKVRTIEHTYNCLGKIPKVPGISMDSIQPH